MSDPQERRRRQSVETPGAEFVDVGDQMILTLLPELLQPGLEGPQLELPTMSVPPDPIMSVPGVPNLGTDVPIMGTELDPAEQSSDIPLAGSLPELEDPGDAPPPPPVGPAARPVAGTATEEGVFESANYARSRSTGARWLFSPSGRTAGGGGGARISSTTTLGPPPVGLEELAQLQQESLQSMTSQAAIDAATKMASGQIIEDEAIADSLAAERYAEIAEEHFANSQQRVQELGGFLDQMATNRIDPNRMWATRGGGARFSAMMAVAGNVMAQALNPNVGNQAMSIIQQAIENDIQAQLADSQNQRFVAQSKMNLLGVMRQNFGDETSALLAVRNIKTQEAINRLRAIAARGGAQQALATLQGSIAQLRQQQIQDMNEILARQYSQSIAVEMRLRPEQVQGYITGQRAAMNQYLGMPAPEQAQPARGRRRAGGGQPQAAAPSNAVAVDVFETPGGGTVRVPVDAFGNPVDPRWEAEPARLDQARQIASQFGERAASPRGIEVLDQQLWNTQVSSATGRATLLAHAAYPRVASNIQALKDVVRRMGNVELTERSPEWIEFTSLAGQMLGFVQPLVRGDLGLRDVQAEQEASRLRDVMTGGPVGRFNTDAAVDAQLAALDRIFRTYTQMIGEGFSAMGGQFDPTALEGPSDAQLEGMGSSTPPRRGRDPRDVGDAERDPRDVAEADTRGRPLP